MGVDQRTGEGTNPRIPLVVSKSVRDHIRHFCKLPWSLQPESTYGIRPQLVPSTPKATPSTWDAGPQQEAWEPAPSGGREENYKEPYRDSWDSTGQGAPQSFTRTNNGTVRKGQAPVDKVGTERSLSER